MLEYDRGQGNKEYTAKQYKYDRRDDANLGLTNIPLLRMRVKRGGERDTD